MFMFAIRGGSQLAMPSDAEDEHRVPVHSGGNGDTMLIFAGSPKPVAKWLAAVEDEHHVPRSPPCP